jgi:hypothetical protein
VALRARLKPLAPGLTAEIRRHAAELVALAPDVIFATGSGIGPLREATRTVPIGKKEKAPQVSRGAKVSDWLIPVGVQRVELIASIRRDFGDAIHPARKNTECDLSAPQLGLQPSDGRSVNRVGPGMRAIEARPDERVIPAARGGESLQCR